MTATSLATWSPSLLRTTAASTSARRKSRRSRLDRERFLPGLLHGGPGRAGGGEELGGERGMRLYQQRTALQGDKSILKALLET